MLEPVNASALVKNKNTGVGFEKNCIDFTSVDDARVSSELPVESTSYDFSKLDLTTNASEKKLENLKFTDKDGIVSVEYKQEANIHQNLPCFAPAQVVPGFKRVKMFVNPLSNKLNLLEGDLVEEVYRLHSTRFSLLSFNDETKSSGTQFLFFFENPIISKWKPSQKNLKILPEIYKFVEKYILSNLRKADVCTSTPWVQVKNLKNDKNRGIYNNVVSKTASNK